MAVRPPRSGALRSERSWLRRTAAKPGGASFGSSGIRSGIDQGSDPGQKAHRGPPSDPGGQHGGGGSSPLDSPVEQHPPQAEGGSGSSQETLHSVSVVGLGAAAMAPAGPAAGAGLRPHIEPRAHNAAQNTGWTTPATSSTNRTTSNDQSSAGRRKPGFQGNKTAAAAAACLFNTTLPNMVTLTLHVLPFSVSTTPENFHRGRPATTRSNLSA